MRKDPFAVLTLAALGIALILNLYSPVFHPSGPVFWGDTIQPIGLGFIASTISAWLFASGWSKALPPGQKLWQSLNLAQKAILGFFACVFLRSALNLLLIALPGAGWAEPAVPGAQVIGSLALALVLVLALIPVYRDAFTETTGKPLRAKVELLIRFALVPCCAAWSVVSIVWVFSIGEPENPALALANYGLMLAIALLLLGLSIFKLPEGKMKWMAATAGSGLMAAYALFRLLGG